MSPEEHLRRRIQLKDAGIPFISPDAVWKCARRIKSGAAYFAAAQWFEAKIELETWPQAVNSLLFRRSSCYRWYHWLAGEAK